jgi:exopolyphosphatase/guanosine-5'-triphosphate,3'-diphosphate pyrophosphatase
MVSKLAAILRLATALDDTRTSRIREIECHVEPTRLVIQVPGVRDVSIEQITMRQQAMLFRDVYGKNVILQAGDD